MQLAFKEQDSLFDFQTFIEKVYASPDDRLYSLWDLLSQEQRFAMRALKGIRKEDQEKLKKNLLIAFSWLMSISNRLHINVDDEVWERFPGVCSYCGECPCACKKIKPSSRKKLEHKDSARPRSLAEMQAMFQRIYPAEKRTLGEEGIHLAEEVGEVSEAIHNYLGLHAMKQFDEVKLEIADCISCFIGIANSIPLDLAHELAAMYGNNCHVCHKAPCECSFTEIARIVT